jgi:Uncharacterized protein conserved in bacteria (DUF2242)
MYPMEVVVRAPLMAFAVCRRAALLSAVLSVTVMAGCAARKHDIARDSISVKAPFSETFSGPSDAVCWSVKRALLSQGYMLDRSSEAGVLTGTREFQPDPKLNVTVHLQTSCADNRDGTSIVFVTASREESRLQKMKQSTSVGVGPATLTMPSGSAEVLGVVRRETIQDPDFYNSFFSLINGFVAQERAADERRRHSDERQAQAENRPAKP